MSSRSLNGSWKTAISTPESITIQRNELHRAWSHCNPKPSTWSSGNHSPSTFLRICNQVVVSTWRTWDASLSTCKLNCLRLRIELLARKWVFLKREQIEPTFITWNRSSWSIPRSNTTLKDIQARKRSHQQLASTPSIRKVTEPSTPIPCQSPMVLAWARMLHRMRSIPSSWPSLTSLSTIRT